MAKAKKISVDLDALITKDKISVVSEAEIVKMKDAKFSGGTKKLPSLTARGIYDELMKKPADGRAIDITSLSEEQKQGVVRTLKKELMRCARAAKKDDLRVRAVDQGNRVTFFFDKKKEKKSKEEKKVASGKR